MAKEWTSTDVSLPAKYSGARLVTTTDGLVRVAEHRGSNWWVSIPGRYGIKVAAWRDLPESWRALSVPVGIGVSS